MATRDEVYIDIITEIKKSVANLAKYVAAIGGAVIAVKKIVAVAKDFVKAYSEQEIAETKLTAAIRATGREAQMSVKALSDYASELQNVTTWGDELTISAMAMLQSLGDLDNKGLRQLTPLVQDFAAAMGLDLEAAASLVGKTVGSTTNALARYGIQIDATAPKQEKITQLTEELQKKFGGLSKDLAQTATGSLKQFNNAVGDLKEIGGKAILVFLQPGVRWLTEIAKEAGTALTHFQKLHEILNSTVKSNVAAELIAQMGELQIEIDRVNKMLAAGIPVKGMTLKEAREYVVELQNKIEGLRRQLVTLGKDGKPAIEQGITEPVDESIPVVREFKGALGELRAEYQSFLDMRYMWSEAPEWPSYEAIRHAEEYAGAIRNVTNEMEELDKKQKEMADNATQVFTAFGEAFAETAVKGGDAFKEAAKAAGAAIMKILGQEAMVRAGMALAAGRFGKAAVWAGIGTTAFTYAAAIRAMAEGGIVTKPTVALIGERGPEAVVPLGKAGRFPSVVVNVNVRGSLITEGQLIQKTTDGVVKALGRGY